MRSNVEVAADMAAAAGDRVPPGRRPAWLRQVAAEHVMAALTAERYLLRVRSDAHPLDPVAASTSPTGCRSSVSIRAAKGGAGGTRSLVVMVNYVYDPDTQERNKRLHLEGGVAVDPGCRRPARRVEALWPSDPVR